MKSLTALSDQVGGHLYKRANPELFLWLRVVMIMIVVTALKITDPAQLPKSPKL